MRRIAIIIGAALLALLLAAALRVGLEFRSEPVLPTPASQAADVVARGEYLARVGHCAGCHTAPGGAAYGGGRALAGCSCMSRLLRPQPPPNCSIDTTQESLVFVPGIGISMLLMPLRTHSASSDSFGTQYLSSVVGV